MSRKVYIVGGVFLVLSVIEVFSLAIGTESLHAYIKPFLMPSLMVTAILALLPTACDRKTITNLAIALTMHTAGDILLLFPGVKFLMAGLTAFLIGHIFYIIILSKRFGKLSPSEALWFVAVPVIMLSNLITMPFDLPVKMRIAVSFYCAALLCITSSGILGVIRKYPYSWLILSGGLFFMGSDLMIALETFMGIDFPFRHPLIMFTYILAEILLAGGIALPYIKNKLLDNQNNTI